jgi:hypothetical protein
LSDKTSHPSRTGSDGHLLLGLKREHTKREGVGERVKREREKEREREREGERECE